jgi:hypothetical protein
VLLLVGTDSDLWLKEMTSRGGDPERYFGGPLMV